MPNSMVPGLRTFSVTAARNGDLFEQDFHAGGEGGAMVSALMAINKAWRTDYRTWDDMACDSDAVQIIEHPHVMADRIPLSLLTSYQMLVAGLHDMIEGRRLVDQDIPADFMWLEAMLARCDGELPKVQIMPEQDAIKIAPVILAKVEPAGNSTGWSRFDRLRHFRTTLADAREVHRREPCDQRLVSLIEQLADLTLPAQEGGK